MAVPPASIRGPAPVRYLRPDDGEQPVANRTTLPVVCQPAHGAGDGADDFLGYVHRIGVLEALSAQVAVDQGGVEIDELRPGRLVPRVAQADEQARTGTWDVGHYPSRQIALTYHYPRAPEIYRAAERFS